MSALDGLEDREFAYLTTRGRRSGRPHRIEIWFGLSDGVLYMLSGGGSRSDWVRNVVADPAIRVEVGDVERPGRARVVVDTREDAAARRLLASKYQGWREGRPLSNWARTALPVAVEPEEAP